MGERGISIGPEPSWSELLSSNVFCVIFSIDELKEPETFTRKSQSIQDKHLKRPVARRSLQPCLPVSFVASTTNGNLDNRELEGRHSPWGSTCGTEPNGRELP